MAQQSAAIGELVRSLRYISLGSGAGRTHTETSFHGSLQSVRIYNRALLETEVKALGSEGSDSDADGLSDYEELYLYRTDAHNADTDGDGSNDGAEVKYGTDANDPLSAPDMVIALPAVELQITTQRGHRYQMETATDLANWTIWGDVFDGTGGNTYRLVSVRGSQRTFWRVKRIEWP